MPSSTMFPVSTVLKTAQWTRKVGAAAAALVLLGAAACGSGGSSAAPAAPAPATLVREVKAAVQHASSVHVSGSITQTGKQLGLDLSMTRAGELSGELSASGAGFF